MCCLLPLLLLQLHQVRFEPVPSLIARAMAAPFCLVIDIDDDHTTSCIVQQWADQYHVRQESVAISTLGMSSVIK
jgi:hypothetical protein